MSKVGKTKHQVSGSNNTFTSFISEHTHTEADYDTPAEIPHQAVLTFKSICAIVAFTDKKKKKTRFVNYSCVMQHMEVNKKKTQ